ncbi:MAG: hypothetical protein P8O86_09605 [Actinomycetota bacterium]|jgi:hypothetical protein|nr:hypothetical protein [Actinomycetota bacterium]MDG2121404.1 hypothetical protein [Actinomycetota bacterium]
MSDVFEPQDLVDRFKERAEAVRKRNLPAVGGEERKHFIQQAELDFLDYGLIADAVPTLDNGILTLTIDLRPVEE